MDVVHVRWVTVFLIDSRLYWQLVKEEKSNWRCSSPEGNLSRGTHQLREYQWFASKFRTSKIPGNHSYQHPYSAKGPRAFSPPVFVYLSSVIPQVSSFIPQVFHEVFALQMSVWKL